MLESLKKFTLAVLAFLVLLFGLAFGFRDALLEFGTGYALAGSQIQVAGLSGVQLTARQFALDSLELQLQAGSRLKFANIRISWHIASWRKIPELLALEIGSVHMVNTDPERGSGQAFDPGEVSPLLLSDLFRILREFPVPDLEIAELAVPQWPDLLALSIVHNAAGLTLNIQSAVLQLHAGFSQTDAASPVQIQLELVRRDTPVGTVKLALEPQRQGQQQHFLLAGTGQLEFTDITALLADLQQASVVVPLSSAKLGWSIAGTVADDLLGDLRGTLPASVELGLQAGSSIVFAADVIPDLEQISLTFTDQLELTVSSGDGVGISAGRVPLHLASSWEAQPVLIDAEITLAHCMLNSTEICEVGFDGKAGLGSYSLQGLIKAGLPGLNAGYGHYSLQTSGLELGGLPALIPGFDIDATLLLDQDSLRFSSPLQPRNVPHDAGLGITGTYSFTDGVAIASLVLPELGFEPDSGPLSAWLQNMPWPFDVLDGSVDALLDMLWQPRVHPGATGIMTATLSSNLKEAGGFYNDIYFRGLTGTLQSNLMLAEELEVSTPILTFSLAGIDAGLPLENLHVEVGFDSASATLVIPSVHGETLGGTVHVENVEYHLDSEINEATLHFDGLRLERMLALAEYKGVEAVGAVSGQLPLVLTSSGFEMTGGTLQADAPGGSIAYLDAAQAGQSGNAGLDLVNQVLRDYQFSSITSTVDYTPEGELLLALQMQGYNPEMGADQPINLNLNLSDNIPALLESLRAARAIEDFLEQNNH